MQGTGYVLVGTEAVFDIFACDLLYGADDVAFFLYAVTYDYDLFKTGVVLFERYVDRGLVVDGNKLALVADETEVQRFLAGNRDRVASFDVGGGTARRIRDRNCYTYDRIAALVFNDTRNGISPPPVP